MKKHLLFLLLAFAGMTWAQNTPMHGWHSYCTNEFADAISYGTHTTVATCYPPDMASNFAGTQITKVAIFSDGPTQSIGGIYTCSIYLGGDTPSEGSIVYTMSCDVPQGLNDWAEFDLSTPIGVTGDETIWIVWQAEQPLSPWHMGVCGDIDPSGNGIWAWNGTQWDQIWFSTGDWMVKTYFNWDGPLPQNQDVYFAGNGDGIGKIWKNNALVYSLSDSSAVMINDMKVVNDSTIYSAGYNYSDFRGHVWLNDSSIFTTDDATFIERIIVDANGWTAAGGNQVWQNGEMLYEYTIDSITCNLYALEIDTITGDIYAGGSIVTPGVYACVWKNDTIFWQCPGWSEVKDLCFDGENLYAAGFVYGANSIDGVVWQNDSIIFQIPDGDITAIAAFNGSLYWAGVSATENTAYIWQDGEVLYDHPNCFGFNTLCVNESGIYYAGIADSIATLWKDGEILYTPEDCESISSICVLPTPPVTLFTITVESNNLDWGTVAGGGSYPYGDTIQIEAIPNLGHEFLAWDDGIVDNPRDIVVTQDSTFVALFAKSQYTIEVISDHPGWGTVTGGGTYYYGDTIQIEATAYMGFAFAGWDDGVAANPRTVIVTQDETFTAHFEIRQCVITTEVYPENSGTVNGGGTYNYGSTVHLTAHSNTGYVFSQWSDGNITNPRSIFVEGDATYTAVFTPLQYEITTEADPVEGGTVTGAGTYDYGSTATLTATPNENYIFLCWSDGIASNPRHVTVTGNANYKALFHYQGAPQYTITVLANNPELGTVTGSGTYPEGVTIEISATPAEGALFNGWDDGNTDNPRSVTVTQDMTFTAIFEASTPVEMYTITVSSANPLQGTVYGGGTYPVNTVIHIGATPTMGFHFSGWQDGDMNNPRTITVTHDAEYVAYFTHNPVETYTVTVLYDESEGFILGAGTYSAGAIASIAAIPADGFYFKKWDDGSTDNPKEIVVDHDIVMAAFFEGTGVDDEGFQAISLYPNPANDEIRIEGLEGEHEVSIFNAMGMKVMAVTLQDEGEIHIDELSAGLYLLRIDEKYTIRFVKK